MDIDIGQSDQINISSDELSSDLPVNPQQNVTAVSTNNTSNQCWVCKWEHDDFQPKRFHFDDFSSGLVLDFEDGAGATREIEIFHRFFNWDLVSHIANETNKYARDTVSYRKVK
uniref:Uncharacterized protein n=1 Tax=Graphocephala atropunctata TaxID=36148 RepID=A0A1B6MIT1_9HEMI